MGHRDHTGADGDNTHTHRRHWPAPASAEPMVKQATTKAPPSSASIPLHLKQGSAEHRYLKHFDDWEKAVQLTFQLGLALAVSKLDVGEGVIGQKALSRLVRTYTGGMPTRELSDPEPQLCAACRTPMGGGGMTAAAAKQDQAQQLSRRRGQVSSESEEWFTIPGSPATRTKPGEQLRFRKGGYSGMSATVEFDGREFAERQTQEYAARMSRSAQVVGAAPPWIGPSEDDEDDSAPWGIGQRIKPKQRSARKGNFDVPPPDKTYGAPTPAYDGVGVQGQYLRGAPGGMRPTTAPARPWALDPDAKDMFAEAELQRQEAQAQGDYMLTYHRQQEQERQMQMQQQQQAANDYAEQEQEQQRQPGGGQRVSWAQENEERNVIQEPSWHDSYANESMAYDDGADLDQGPHVQFGDPSDDPPDLVEEPLSPEEVPNPDQARWDAPPAAPQPKERLGMTGRIVTKPDGRRVWGPIQSLSPPRDGQLAKNQLMSAEERAQKANEEHGMRMRRSTVSKQKASQKKEKVRKTPWRNSTTKPAPFPNPYDNGPRWSETLRKMDDVVPPSATDLERRAAELRRAASAERRSRNRADQAEWDTSPAADGAPPSPNPYEDPVAWVQTLRGAEDDVRRIAIEMQ